MSGKQSRTRRSPCGPATKPPNAPRSKARPATNQTPAARGAHSMAPGERTNKQTRAAAQLLKGAKIGGVSSLQATPQATQHEAIEGEECTEAGRGHAPHAYSTGAVQGPLPRLGHAAAAYTLQP